VSDAASVPLPPPPEAPGTAVGGALARIDSFPYRHRLSELMSGPPVCLPPTASLADAARRMDRDRISSVLVADADGRPAGIVTERDVLRLVAREGGDALARPLAAVMSSPVECLPPDAFVYRAIARMDRLSVRHLAVGSPGEPAVGVITARGLLRQRARKGLALGDQILAAPDAAALGAARALLPELARGLLAEEVSPATVAAVLSDALRHMTARAAELAEAELGPAPAPWCLLVLGSAGREESLLAPDQDNAIVHEGGPAEEPWFERFGARVSEILDAAGVPFCKGGVMASRPQWRRSAEGWRAQVDRWVGAPHGENLLAVDIFFDFRPAAGDARLAEELRAHALGRARGSIGFLKNLAAELDAWQPPIGWWGGIRTRHGAVDLKMGALFPAVAAARILSLRHGIAATGTAARYDALVAGGRMPPGDAEDLKALHRIASGLILNQQLGDVARGRVPSTRVEVRGLDPRVRNGLRRALAACRNVAAAVRDALT
jgi:signal-transduction protein with cAMP-binding, CBS, and nucleotidyltransferase domain